MRKRKGKTYHVEILDVIRGTGSSKNRISYLITPFGDVKKGLTSQMRKKYAKTDLRGQTIEVVGHIKNGKFLEATFLNFRTGEPVIKSPEQEDETVNFEDLDSIMFTA